MSYRPVRHEVPVKFPSNYTGNDGLVVYLSDAGSGHDTAPECTLQTDAAVATGQMPFGVIVSVNDGDGLTGTVCVFGECYAYMGGTWTGGTSDMRLRANGNSQVVVASSGYYTLGFHLGQDDGAVGELARVFIDPTESIDGTELDLHAGFRDAYVVLSVTPGAEGAVLIEAFDVAIQVQDPDGANISSVTTLHAIAYDNVTGGQQADIELSEEGGGTALSTTAVPALFFQTDASGAAVLRVLDHTGMLGETVHVVVYVLDADGRTEYIPLTFS